MPNCRHLLVLVAASLVLVFVLALASAPAVQAQDTSTPAGEAAPSTETLEPEAESPKTESPEAKSPEAETPEAETNGDRAVAAFSEALDRWSEQLEAQELSIAEEATSDEELRAIPEQLEALRDEIVEQRAALKPKLQDARERLAKLGATPENGAPKESAEIAAQRKRLEAEVAAFDGKLKRADILFVRAGQLIDAANDERRDRFTESLFRPVPNFYSKVIPEGLELVSLRSQQVRTAASDWFERAWDIGTVFFILLFLVPIAAAAVVGRFIGGLRKRNDAKRDAKKDEAPSLQKCGTAAFKKSVWRCMPVWTGLAVFYVIGASANLADPTLNGFLLKALLSLGWAALLASLVRQSLVPHDEVYKIIPASEPVAWRLAGLLWALIFVWLVDQLSVLTDLVVFMPYQVSVLRSAIFAALYGTLLAVLLFAIQSGPITRKATFGGWRGWLFWFVALQVAIILLAMLLGYESLARFIGTHIVSTAGVLWIMYLLHLMAEDISSVSVISGAPIDDGLEQDEDMGGAPSLLTIRIIVSLLLDITIIAVGVTILLLLWRFDWVEVKGWIQAAFFGFEFGNFRISLQSVLIALSVFAVGLLLTRFVQRWFTGRVFAGRRSDSGLHESMRVGIGYLGFTLAALAGISYLGVDFSNLAIIAGALSVGIGFGLQSIFNNFVSGLILLAERPIKIGDYIQVGDQEGTVKKISVRSTEIETIHRQSVIIPNATLITDPVTNWMHLDKSCRLDIPIGVDYGTDIELLRSTLLGVAEKYRGVLKSPPPIVHFSGFGDSSLDFELRVFLGDVRERIKSSSELRFAILAALRDAGISIPFPQRDLHIKDGSAAAPARAPGKRQPSTA
ncbi:MAG TPA: mechanosensitive ion channel domain-containing protein [Methyloceanibacter sp.]|nr:mechanosensitive ion channel domain-containing protein [Methyloceanibacter sp.]